MLKLKHLTLININIRSLSHFLAAEYQLTPHLGEDAMQHKINHPKVDAAHWPASGWMD